MSDRNSAGDAGHELTSPAATDWTEKQLPPVKPPTAGLMMQLFFVPMIIVSIIVAVWFMFGWLAQSGATPEQLAANLEKLNKGSWQDAHGLSNMLRDPRESELRKNEEIAARLAKTLDQMLASEQLGSDQQNLALWLCRALAQFDVDTGLDSLARAMSAKDLRVRLAAIQGIGILVDRLGVDVAANSDLITPLQEAAFERGENPEQAASHGLLRAASAYSLGIIGGDQARDILANMLADAYPDVRYNAATGLARWGDARALPRLKEMLSIDNQEAIRFEQEIASNQAWKQQLVIKNGLEALIQLHEKNPALNPDPDVSKLLQQLQASGEIPVELRIQLEKAMAVVK